uniref:Acetylglutamate kinase n=1 Tax=Spyridia filamentosa TaxID=196632 RepID=A0A1Z1MKF6_SPYFI|nr:acetylglutamate kinase [Spyridia filamentosa]ARW66285.1 acetylglutamate kinase [Spyridia filamentosa]
MTNNFSSCYQISSFVTNARDNIFVIKYGGSVMKNEILKFQIMQDIAFLHSIGIKIILVHGGGFFINYWLNRLNISSYFDKGIRITDLQTMSVTEMVLSGQVNKDLVALLNQLKISAVGLSGKDGSLIMASPISDSVHNLTGQVRAINANVLNVLISNNYIPIVSSVALGLDGRAYNINADTAAGAIAKAVGASKLILLTDTPGIMLNLNDSSTLIKNLNTAQIQDLKKNKIIHGGMIPKVDCCIDAVNHDVSSAHIIDGRINHALLLETLTYNRLGSTIKA